MKKLACFALALVLLICFATSCEMIGNLMEGLESKAISAAVVDEMMGALAENRADDAKALIHPEKADNSDGAINDMISYLDGRTVVSKQITGVNINKSVSTAGNVLTEDLTYDITLSDGSTISIASVYVENNAGKGFTTFRFYNGIN